MGSPDLTHSTETNEAGVGVWGVGVWLVGVGVGVRVWGWGGGGWGFDGGGVIDGVETDCQREEKCAR